MNINYCVPNLLPSHGQCYLYKSVFSNLSITKLIKEIKWRNDKISFFGKIYEQPRKVAWYGDKNITYKYSGISMNAINWTNELAQLNELLKQNFQLHFNSVLLNYYRDGDDYMSYHSDDEKELGPKPEIASISLGESRDFIFRFKQDHKIKIFTKLEHGDLLIMKGDTQRFWQHQLPKRKRVKSPRLNLTFRMIK